MSGGIPKQYVVVWGDGIPEFEQRINELAVVGYEPHGSLTVNGSTYIQLMAWPTRRLSTGEPPTEVTLAARTSQPAVVEPSDSGAEVDRILTTAASHLWRTVGGWAQAVVYLAEELSTVTGTPVEPRHIRPADLLAARLTTPEMWAHFRGLVPVPVYDGDSARGLIVRLRAAGVV